MSKLTKNPNQYYDNYEEVASKIDPAVTCANAKNAIKIAENVNAEARNLTSISATGDKVVQNLINVVKTISSKLSMYVSAANNYGSQIEPLYEYVKIQLEELKEQEDDYKNLCNNGPDSNDEKYKDHEELYYSDVSEWESRLTEMENLLQSMCDNVDFIISKLESAGNADIASVAENGFNLKLQNISPYTDFDNFNGYLLKGDELLDFLKDNNIPNEDYISVYKDYAYINGVKFPVYYVLDKDCTSEENEKFDKYIKDCMKNAEKIDSSVLNTIAEGGTAFIFEQTYRCDGGSLEAGYFKGAAYCNSDNRNVVQFFGEGDYYSRSIVHELGHAFDFTLRHNLNLSGEESKGISGIKDYYGKLTKEQLNNLYITDENGEVLTWDKIINNEVNYFDSSHDSNSPCSIDNFSTKADAEEFFNSKCTNGKLENLSQYTDSNGETKWKIEVSYNNFKYSEGVTIDGNGSVYNVHDYKGASCEYFADSFQAYYLCDDKDRYKYLCPQTYSAIDKLVKNQGN